MQYRNKRNSITKQDITGSIVLVNRFKLALAAAVLYPDMVRIRNPFLAPPPSHKQLPLNCTNMF